MHRVSGRRVGSPLSCGFFGFFSKNPMATIATEPPSGAEGSGSFTIALYNIQSGHNGGLESALQAMKLMGVDCGVFLETKLTKGVYTRWSSGTTSAVPMRQASGKEGLASFGGLVKRMRSKRWRCVGRTCCHFSSFWVLRDGTSWGVTSCRTI